MTGPRDISGLLLWLAADIGSKWQDSAATTLALANADPVGKWEDLSGNGYHVTQATGSSRPTLQLASQNGLPGVQCDGVDDFMTNSGIGNWAASGFTTFVVSKGSTGNGSKLIFGGLAAGQLGCAGGTSNNQAAYYRQGQAGFNLIPTLNGGTITRIRCYYGNALSGGAGTLFGTQDASAESSVGVTGISANTGVAIAGYSNAGTPADLADHTYYEVVCYSSNISSLSKAAILAYLTTKWLQSSWPGFPSNPGSPAGLFCRRFVNMPWWLLARRRLGFNLAGAN